MLDKPKTDSASNDLIAAHLSGVYVVGPSSAGKTTLCRALAARLNFSRTRHVSEVARTVMQSTLFTREHVGMIDMQKAILHAQVEAENQARAQHVNLTEDHITPFLLCDRSAVDPIVYAYLSSAGQGGAKMLIEGAELRKLLPVYRNALFVLLNPVEEWVEDDGVRSFDDPYRYPIAFKTISASLGIDYKEMGEELKELEDRVDQVLEWIRERESSASY